MPARIVTITTETEIAELFGLLRDVDDPLLALKPRYNVAPPQTIPVIRMMNGARELAAVRWGLIPHWNRDPAHEGHVNARAETVSQKPSFRDAFLSRRCLVPASGFYGWRAGGKRKQPYYFRPAGGGVFVCAAIWDRWYSLEDYIETVAVLTMPANELVKPTDERMPVILGEEHFTAWLDPNNKRPAQLLTLLDPFPAEKMKCWPVSTRVNSPTEDDPDLLTPIPDPL